MPGHRYLPEFDPAKRLAAWQRDFKAKLWKKLRRVVKHFLKKKD